MGMLDRIFGTERRDGAANHTAPLGSDAYALDRYRYMLQTAPPETIEQAHTEAFARLTPEQRRQMLMELGNAAPAAERASIERGPDDARSLARAATRAELRQPGIVERTLGTSHARGFGASLLGSFAAAFAGSMVANAFFSGLGDGVDFGVGDTHAGAGGAGDEGGLAGDFDGDFDGGSFDV